MIQLIVGATMISFSGVFVMLAQVGPTMAGFYRTFFGSLILFAIVLIQKKRLWKGFGPFLMAGACALFFALDLDFWHRSVHYVGPGLATLLANFQVFFLAGFGILVFGEKLSWKFVASVFLSMLGLFMIVGIDWNYLEAIYKIGVIFGLAAAFFYSAYLLVLRKLQSGARSLTSMANMATISLITSFMMGLEGWARQEAFHIPDAKSCGVLIAYGFAGQAVGWVLISKGLPKIEASRAGLILLLQPILTFFWDILFFARPISVIEATGAIVALSGIYLGATRQSI